jgi:hypothetical protein
MPTRITDLVGVTADAFIMFQARIADQYRFVEKKAYYAEPDLFPDPDFTKPEVGSFMDYRDGQGMVSRSQDFDYQNYPYRAKILKQHVYQISGGTDYVSRMYAGASSAMAITNEGRVLTWNLRQPTEETAPLTFIKDLPSPQLADPLAFLGSFEVLRVKAMKCRANDPLKVAGAVYLTKRTNQSETLNWMVVV